MSDRRTLHPYQNAVLDNLRHSWSRQKAAGRPIRTVCQLPTGGGKTVVQATLSNTAIDHARAIGRSTTIGVIEPRISLVDQTVVQMQGAGIRWHDIGVIQADHKRANAMASLFVCSPQTMLNRSTPPFDLLLVDECHEGHKWTREFLMAHPEVPAIGWSATPWAKGMANYWNDLVIGATQQGLIDQGFLANFKAFAPPSGVLPDLFSIATSEQAHGKDYVVEQLSAEMQKPKLVADAIDTWSTMAKGRPTLTYAVDRAHARVLQEQFCAAGVEAAYIDAKTDVVERERIRLESQRGRIEVVVSIGCLTMGIDWPWVSCIQLLRPTKSEILYVQIVGRGLRKSEGKDYCLILDHTRTTEKLGLVTNIHHDLLDDGKPKISSGGEREEAKPHECPACHMLKPPKHSTCPNCGFTAQRQNKVTTQEGYLAEVTKAKKYTMSEKQSFYSGLLHYARLKGYKAGWAANKYRAKHGVWPRKLQKIATEPRVEVLNFIKSQNIAWAHSKNNPVNQGGAS
jgi:DNA repair protein RadD